MNWGQSFSLSQTFFVLESIGLLVRKGQGKGPFQLHLLSQVVLHCKLISVAGELIFDAMNWLVSNLKVSKVELLQAGLSVRVKAKAHT